MHILLILYELTSNSKSSSPIDFNNPFTSICPILKIYKGRPSTN